LETAPISEIAVLRPNDMIGELSSAG